MDRRRRRVTYRPSKANSIFSGIVGIIFVVIGLFMVIPTFGLFGLVWTVIAAGMAGFQFYNAFEGKYVGPEINIEEDGDTPHIPVPPTGLSSQKRLEELRTLYDQRLITQEEYEQKRKEILENL